MRSFFSNMALRTLVVLLISGVILIASFFIMYGTATGLESVFKDNHGLGWVVTGTAFLLGSMVFLKINFKRSDKLQPDSVKASDEIDVIKVSDWAKEMVQKYPIQSTSAALALGFILSGEEKSIFTDILKDLINKKE